MSTTRKPPVPSVPFMSLYSKLSEFPKEVIFNAIETYRTEQSQVKGAFHECVLLPAVRAMCLRAATILTEEPIVTECKVIDVIPALPALPAPDLLGAWKVQHAARIAALMERSRLNPPSVPPASCLGEIGYLPESNLYV